MKKVFKITDVQLKYVSEHTVEKADVRNSRDAFDYIVSRIDWERADGQEFFYIICLTRNNHICALHEAFVGGFNSVVVDPKVVFATALLAAASNIIIAHNHPSGNLSPSNEDCRITKKLFEAGKCLDLPLIDHLIVTRDGYYSFADEGKLG